MTLPPSSGNRDRTPLLLAAAVVITGLVAAAAGGAADPYHFQLYGDANSRLVQTRMMVDSQNPGLHWIGSVWLPLPGLLFLPFSLVDALFFSGLAGLAVGLPLLAGMAVMLFRLLLRVTGHRTVAAGVSLCAALNPNVLYISMTAMTETATLFFVVGAVLGWTTWVAGRSTGAGSVRALFWGSISAAAATLCRYEAWWFAVAGAAGLACFVLARRESMRARLRLLAIAALSGAGIGLWLLWNGWQFGDPLHFHRAEYYSAAWQALRRPVRETYYLQLGNSLGIYGTTLAAVFGYVFLSLSAIGAARLWVKRPRAETVFLALILLVMPVFTLVSLYLGVAEMTRWWNSRYVLLLSPFVAVTVAVALAGWSVAGWAPKRVGAIIAGAFLATVGYQMGWSYDGVVTYRDARGGFLYRQTPHATEVGEWLRRDWRGGLVLCATGSGQSHRIMQPSRIALRHFVTALNDERQYDDVDAIGREFEWVVVGLEPSPDGAEIAAHLATQADALARHYDRVLANEFYVLYRRR